MRFKRIHEWMPYVETKRKRLAVVLKQRREREAAPLFAEQIASTQMPIDEELALRGQAFEDYQQGRRDSCAQQWRRARARMRSFGELSSALYRLWNEAPYPGDPVYLLGMLHDFSVGRFTIDAPPWRFSRQQIDETRARIDKYCDEQKAAREAVLA